MNSLQSPIHCFQAPRFVSVKSSIEPVCVKSEPFRLAFEAPAMTAALLPHRPLDTPAVSSGPRLTCPPPPLVARWSGPGLVLNPYSPALLTALWQPGKWPWFQKRKGDVQGTGCQVWIANATPCTSLLSTGRQRAWEWARRPRRGRY